MNAFDTLSVFSSTRHNIIGYATFSPYNVLAFFSWYAKQATRTTDADMGDRLENHKVL